MTLNVDNFDITISCSLILMLKLRQFKFLQNSRNMNFLYILEHFIYMFVTLHCLYHVCLFIDICEKKNNSGLGKTFIKILFPSNLHICMDNVPALLLNQNCNIVPKLPAYITELSYWFLFVLYLLYIPNIDYCSKFLYSIEWRFLHNALIYVCIFLFLTLINLHACWHYFLFYEFVPVL